MGVRVSISCGDLHGIGLEVIGKALMHESLHGNEINVYVPRGTPLIPARNVRTIGELEHTLQLGVSTKESANWAVRSLEMAAESVASGASDVLVTAPIDKHAMDRVGFPFPGHTEYLAKLDNKTDYLMFLISDKLRMGTITGHIPLQFVAATITEKLIIDKLAVIHASLSKDFGLKQPRIAVLGLNPHAGDQGRLGQEEIDVIEPAIKKANELGITAWGPFPADGFFGSQQYQQFDAVLSMYHDQGLVPFKALTFGAGVNFTAGLSFVRTSPDHGTAFSIAGKNQANESSMLNAIHTGIQIFNARNGTT